MAPREDVSAPPAPFRPWWPVGSNPVAVVFSGLETFRDRLAGVGTYASRLPVQELANLEPSAARLALVDSAARRHVAWEDEALGLLVRRSTGHPYYVQLFGWHAWEAAQDEATITLAHAKAGLRRPEPSWRASTKSPGATCGPKSATTWPPWPAWPAPAAPG